MAWVWSVCALSEESLDWRGSLGVSDTVEVDCRNDSFSVGDIPFS